MSKPLLVIGNKNYSSWSLRAWLALRKSGVDFEERRLPLDTPEFAAGIRDLSPTRRVPVLWHEERCIWDSLAICEYVNEVFAAGKLLPAEAGARARVRSVCAEMHAGFPALRNALPMNLRASGRRVEMDHAVEADISRILKLWTECRDSYGEGGPWLFGEFSIADAMYAPVALRLPTYGFELEGVPGLYQSSLLEDGDLREWIDAGLSETDIVQADEAG